jgi:hypothetical protein
MTPKQVERLEKTLGRVAREQGLDQEGFAVGSRLSHFAEFWRPQSRKVSSISTT